MADQEQTPSYLKIDRLGRPTVLGGGLRQRLSHQAGYYRAETLRGGALTFSRVDEAPRQSELREPVIMQGDIGAIGSSIEVINFVHSARLSGRLTLTRGAIRKSISFQDGDVVAARSNEPRDRLSAVLSRRGLLSDAALSEATAVAERLHQPLGNYLLEAGLVEQGELFQSFQLQVEEIFFSLLTYGSGDFALTQYQPGADSTPLRMSAQQLLLDGLRRLDEVERFRELFPSDQVRLRALPGATPPATATVEQRELLDELKESKTIGALKSGVHLSQFELLQRLFQLVEMGALEIVARVEEEPRLSPAALLQLYNEAFELLAIFARERGEEGSLSHGLSLFLQSDQGGSLFEEMSFDARGHLDPEQLQRRLSTYPEQQRLPRSAEALSELLYFQLFVARSWLEGEQAARVETIFDELSRLAADAVGEVFA